MFRRLTFLALIGLFSIALAACERVSGPGEARILVLGDSILAWNKRSGQAIPDVVAQELGTGVVNASVPGSGLTRAGSLFSITIPSRFRTGDWDWIVVNGGANDLHELCGCAQCDDMLDRLISEDGRTGVWPGFVRQMRRESAGTRILILGYYGPVNGGGGGFDACNDELFELDLRLARMAGRDADVIHISARDVFDGSPALYDDDKVHPSPRGSALIGRYVAQTIAKAQP